ncbi:MAG: helix-turn-helix transcriptional regulator [Clostridia bacterium]|nr:helix-turn-helix transcriptional regulator [Clostridia bacterium]
MDTRKAVANRLLELCEQRRLSVNGLARISAVPPSTLKNIINGGSQNAGIVTLKKLCDGLDISLFDFFNTDIFKTLEQEIK